MTFRLRSFHTKQSPEFPGFLLLPGNQRSKCCPLVLRMGLRDGAEVGGAEDCQWRKGSVVTKAGCHVSTRLVWPLRLPGRLGFVLFFPGSALRGMFPAIPDLQHLQFRPGKLEVSAPPWATVDAPVTLEEVSSEATVSATTLGADVACRGPQSAPQTCSCLSPATSPDGMPSLPVLTVTLQASPSDRFPSIIFPPSQCFLRSSGTLIAPTALSGFHSPPNSLSISSPESLTSVSPL